MYLRLKWRDKAIPVGDWYMKQGCCISSKSRHPQNVATYFSQHIVINTALKMSPHVDNNKRMRTCIVCAYK